MEKRRDVAGADPRGCKHYFGGFQIQLSGDEPGIMIRIARKVGLILTVSTFFFFLSTVIPPQIQAAPLPKGKCVKTYCKRPNKHCVKAFRAQLKDAKAACRELSGRARKLCNKENKGIFKENKGKCKTAVKACKKCCKDPQTTSCGVAVLGDRLCGGMPVTEEQCDGEDDSACPGACRADCTCPPPSTSTTTVPLNSTTTTITPGTTTATIASCIEQIRDGNVIAAKESCALAAAGDPSSSLANLLAALTGLLVDVLQTPTLTGPIPRFGVQPLGSAATLCGLSVAYLPEIPPGAPTTGTVASVVRDDAISLVNNTLTYLDRIPRDAIIHFDPENLPSCLRLSGIGDVEIDSGEFLLLRAALNAVAASAHLVRAYDGNFNLADAMNNNHSPKEIFLGNPGLLTLIPGVGTTELELARSRFDAALQSFIDAIDFIDVESDDQSDDVIVIAPPDQANVGLARAAAARLRTALTGVATFEASVFPLLDDQRLMLADLFNGAVVSLRPFVPEFDRAGRPDLCRFPDPRFGGLAPDMTPEELSRFVCPGCGDGVLGLDEECDGASDSACPGRCNTDCLCRPLFDDCERGETIPSLPFEDVKDTSGATIAPDDPFLSCGDGGRQAHSVWYRLVSPGNGTVVADTTGSAFDTVLAAHTGACGSLEEIACDDDGGRGLASVIRFPVTEGTEYSLEITSYNLGSGGALTLNVLFSPCGNGVLDEGEECDPPGSVGECPGHEFCLSDCSCSNFTSFYCPPNTSDGPNLLTMTLAEGGDLDVGWTGLGHNQGIVTGPEIYACLQGCDTGSNPVCTGTGLTGPGSMNGWTYGPPLPLLAADVATCVTNQFLEDITIRELNLQTGEIEMRLKLNSIVHLTGDKETPCPTCSGESIGAIGTCRGSTPSLGRRCTTEGVTVNFGNTSSDCRPFAADGAGHLEIVLDPFTSATVTRMALDPCPGGLCLCPGGGHPVKMNECDNPTSCSAQVCTDNGGSDDVRTGIKPGIDQECCARGQEIIPCFRDVISRTGEAIPAEPSWPDPTYPKNTAGTKMTGIFCIPPANMNTINGPIGLGGPGAVVTTYDMRVGFMR